MKGMMVSSLRDGQNGRPARPQQARGRGVLSSTLSRRAPREQNWRAFSASR